MNPEPPVRVNLVCHRSRTGVLILPVTHRPDLRQALAWYPQRWSTESTFAYLKRRGLDSLLEAIHHFGDRWREYRHYCRLLGIPQSLERKVASEDFLLVRVA